MSSGTKNDQGKAPIHFLTREFIEGVAQAQGYGAKKYDAYNFCKGLSHTRLLDAAFRHLFAYTWGEDIDAESGIPHIFLAGANLNMLSYMVKNHPELDDRYRSENKISEGVTSMLAILSENPRFEQEEFEQEAKKHTDAAVQNILDGFNKDLMDAETKRFFGLDKK